MNNDQSNNSDTYSLANLLLVWFILMGALSGVAGLIVRKHATVIQGYKEQLPKLPELLLSIPLIGWICLAIFFLITGVLCMLNLRHVRLQKQAYNWAGAVLCLILILIAGMIFFSVFELKAELVRMAN